MFGLLSISRPGFGPPHIAAFRKLRSSPGLAMKCLLQRPSNVPLLLFCPPFVGPALSCAAVMTLPDLRAGASRRPLPLHRIAARLITTPAPGRRRPRYATAVRRCVAVAVGLLLTISVSVGPAWAHGAEGGAEEGYVFVQQALGHLAHDQSPEGVAAAEAKIQEALSATDQDGVDVAIVREAQTALSAGRTELAQQTLQKSIAAAVAELKPASGEETGTTVVGEPLPGRGSLTGADWVLGIVSLLLLVAGVGLALWFRPAQNLAQLRRGLTATPATGTDPATDSPPSSDNTVGGNPS